MVKDKVQDLNFHKILMDGIKEMVFIMRVEDDSKFYYEFLNRTAMEKTGLNESAIGKTFSDVYPVEFADFLYKQYERVIACLDSVTYEDSYELLPGERYYTETTLTPIFTDKKKCTHIVALERDITEKKWGELELKQYWKKLNENNQWYSSLFNYNPNGVVCLNVQGQILNGNDCVENITGYKIQELTDAAFISLLREEERKTAQEHFLQALAGEAVNFQMTMYKKTGETIEILLSFVPIIVDGIVVGVYAILRDITEKIILKEKYEESEQRFRIISEHAHDLITLLDENGRIIYASPSHEKVLGFGHKNYIDKYFFHNVHEYDKYILDESITLSVRRKKPCKLQIRRKHRFKGWIWHELQCSPVFNVQNQFVHMVCISRDIQSQKKYESKLKHFAFHDSLTNLPNRRFLNERLEKALKDQQELSNGLAVIMMDIDHFKSINDTMGHDIGDAVITEFGRRIRNNIRSIDFVARLGGDEFVILTPNTGPKENIAAMAERIQEAMQIPWKIEEHSIRVTTSMGIAIAPKEGATVPSILKTADIALYEAKHAGRDSYIIKED